MKKIYFVGIGGIGVSGLARYYLDAGYNVYGSDKYDSALIQELKKEGANIIVGQDENRIDNSFEKVVYTEAVPLIQSELQKAQNLDIHIETYPIALSKIINNKKLIAVAGTHGKSTTSSMISLMLKNSKYNTNALVGTLLKEFDNKNTYFSNSDYFVLEACEYNRSFLAYNPYIAGITNIDLDHLDYYKDEEDYISAFKSFIDNVKPGGYAILNAEDKNSLKLLNLRNNINYAVIYKTYFELNNKKYYFKDYDLLIPGEHIKFDSKIAYTVGKIEQLEDELIINNLKNYSGAWRRMEIIKTSVNNNILMSDYGHHPNEIAPTLASIKTKYPDKKLIVFFEPHQYSRTLELLDEFKNCFESADKIIIPSIYESRDSEEDKAKINAEKFTNYINHPNKLYGESLKNAENILKQEDEENNNAILLLLGAGNIDNLRNIL